MSEILKCEALISPPNHEECGRSAVKVMLKRGNHLPFYRNLCAGHISDAKTVHYDVVVVNE